ncbi:type II toxin-antitoxin system PrlF family antitoxin [Methylobacterium currus]|uniref:type II toxin-antitoxin system PrlF family antitoxin n=1 Tax=Methylobacterium currus TaxID=2051553 RepID=UPI0013E037C1|nr:type II toxin-antitoxin system PrlF family antitoxin [Methylobacterium currus]UHC16781.1 type II toxin-antitoxin system PrlF family antitoxin [Methylobacterium currus]
MDEGDTMSLRRAENDTDPVVDALLTFLARDMADNPLHITVIPAGLAARMAAFTAGIAVDLDDDIDGTVIL